MIACMGFGKDPFAKQFWKSAWSWKRPFAKSTGIMGFGKDPFAKQFCKRGRGKDPGRVLHGFWKRPMHAWVLEKTYACLCRAILAGAKAPAITKKRKGKHGFGVGGSWVGSCLLSFFCGFLCFIIVFFSVCFPFLVLTFLFYFVCMFGVCFFCVILCVRVCFLVVPLVGVKPFPFAAVWLQARQLTTCHA